MKIRRRVESPRSKSTSSSTNGSLYKDRPQRRWHRNCLSPPKLVGALVLLLVLLFSLLAGNRNKHGKSGPPKDFVMNTPPRKFTKVPEGHQKTFYWDGEKRTFAVIRSLRSRGWTRANNVRDAHLVYTYSANVRFMKHFKPWQRFNHHPGYQEWNDKENMIDGFKAYEEKTNSDLFFLPESYRLNVPKELQDFERVLKEGGINSPWVLKEPLVNQGKGITMLAPNSQELLNVPALVKKKNEERPESDEDDESEAEEEDADEDEEETQEKRYIIQKYICNELTWNKRKFDVRMFWLVASFHPLIIMYQDGYVRIGNSEYDESNFEDTVSHLTTHTGLGEEGKATYEDLKERLTQHYTSSPELRSTIRDPVEHVRNQFKHSLAELAAAFKERSFTPGKELTAENGIGFYGADFAIDNDLDVWMIEPQNGCGLDEDYYFRLDMHRSLFDGMVDTLEEVWRKQEAGEPLLPLENTGNWEIIYADGWKYQYEGYKRSKNKKGCSSHSNLQTSVSRKRRLSQNHH